MLTTTTNPTTTNPGLGLGKRKGLALRRPAPMTGRCMMFQLYLGLLPPHAQFVQPKLGVHHESGGAGEREGVFRMYGWEYLSFLLSRLDELTPSSLASPSRLTLLNLTHSPTAPASNPPAATPRRANSPPGQCVILEQCMLYESMRFRSTATALPPFKDAQCDQPEMCTGTTATYLADVMAANGKSCGAGDLACASGQCTSVSKQCATVSVRTALTICARYRVRIRIGSSLCHIIFSIESESDDPNRSNQCILLSSLLIDGSPCGYGGMCSQGKCMTGSLFDPAKAWYTQNLEITIPVTVVAGLFIIRGILRCIRGRDPALRGAPRGFDAGPPIGSARHERLKSLDDGGFGADVNQANSSGAGFGAVG
ncbi:hypothetical protein C8J56DRAFT_1027226 [Mycena floridula]|nr:hypothetical protein C8J56DRAFT_1027226 [Mycena floridula]